MSRTAIARRIVYRLVVALGRHKLVAALLVIGAVLLGGSTTIESFVPASQVDVAGVQAVGADGGDCADAAMAALVDSSADRAHTAYRCMSPTILQGISEDQFVRQVANRGGTGPGARVQRVSDYQAPSGEHIVYFALTSRTQTVGYIIYLDHSGRVSKME